MSSAGCWVWGAAGLSVCGMWCGLWSVECGVCIYVFDVLNFLFSRFV